MPLCVRWFRKRQARSCRLLAVSTDLEKVRARLFGRSFSSGPDARHRHHAHHGRPVVQSPTVREQVCEPSDVAQRSKTPERRREIATDASEPEPLPPVTICSVRAKPDPDCLNKMICAQPLACTNTSNKLCYNQMAEKLSTSFIVEIVHHVETAATI
ncbi:conserved hypothetical protein [Ricinus communis]|uniref:Uncharacterized protein n=1 Tax=Ricinus communis TaxID=3988 RepID=B9TE69_RICCO|nr:conserved hypothetical protein [Ricinus communis]